MVFGHFAVFYDLEMRDRQNLVSKEIVEKHQYTTDLQGPKHLKVAPTDRISPDFENLTSI